MIGKGAAWGFKLALAYGVVFVFVASIRYGADLAAAPPAGSQWPTYLAGAVSLAVASLGITLILGLAAAALGALTAAAAEAIDRRFNASRQPQTAAAIGFAVAGFVVLLLHGALWNAGLWSWSSLTSSTYLFWLGAPTAIYLGGAWLAGGRATR